MDIATRATRLLELHHTGTTLVLPNVWDAWSARVVAEAGFAALSIGSHPLADSRGQGDNEDMTLDDALDGVRRICAAVPDVPVTADMESGYATAPAELVDRLLEAGAVGLNIEDTVHSEGGRMRSVAEHADYIGALRKGSAAGSLEDLQVMGVHRVTFGPLLQRALSPDLAALVEPWR
jgi:2-methylisocitrate lyase-like PEP mutase family enzyme